jgi:hypothetical protein
MMEQHDIVMVHGQVLKTAGSSDGAVGDRGCNGTQSAPAGSGGGVGDAAALASAGRDVSNRPRQGKEQSVLDSDKTPGSGSGEVRADAVAGEGGGGGESESDDDSSSSDGESEDDDDDSSGSGESEEDDDESDGDEDSRSTPSPGDRRQDPVVDSPNIAKAAGGKCEGRDQSKGTGCDSDDVGDRSSSSKSEGLARGTRTRLVEDKEGGASEAAELPEHGAKAAAPTPIVLPVAAAAGAVGDSDGCRDDSSSGTTAPKAVRKGRKRLDKAQAAASDS